MIQYIIAFYVARGHLADVMARKDDLIEGIAVGATIACLIHCLALPLLIAALPVLSSVLPIPENFHLIALGLAIPATAGALFAGYRRHRLAAPLIAGTVGLTLLALGAIHWGETPLETPVTVVGSLCIAAAHLANWRYRRASHRQAAI
jgi:hypothetical protein